VVSLTVVVPTFNEGGNVPELVDRLAVALRKYDAELLFVDDSTDDTPDIIENTAISASLPIRMLHREEFERIGGLSGAVVAGLREAKHDIVVVIDGDLQHPPEMVPILVDSMSDGVDMVVASRYLSAGSSGGLSNLWRHLVSSASTLLVRGMFPKRVGRQCTDPMTGFFCVDRASIDLERLRPTGFKILFEIMASHDLKIIEEPFVFGTRHRGDSKASWRNGLSFLGQLVRLRSARTQ
jgi:dolichol-phosphate mannosyltransferase